MLRFVVFVVLFLLIGAFFIVSENNLYLINQSARKEFANSYASWLGNVFENTKDLTGYAIRMEWLPG